MDQLVIKTHDFENAKNEIKKFSKNVENFTEIKKVAEQKNGWELMTLLRDWDINHKVTGEELNTVIQAIQKNFISLKERQTKTVAEFLQIYNALEFLDRDYIKAIVESVKNTQKVSDSLKDDKDRIEKIVNKLVEFKNKIEEIDAENFKRKIILQDGEISKINETLKKIDEETKILKYKKEIDPNQNDDSKIENISKKLKFSYIFSGIAITFSIVQLFLNIFGVI